MSSLDLARNQDLAWEWGLRTGQEGTLRDSSGQICSYLCSYPRCKRDSWQQVVASALHESLQAAISTCESQWQLWGEQSSLSKSPTLGYSVGRKSTINRAGPRSVTITD